MKNQVLDMALACAQCGWPVFPCQPGKKTPATRHGYLDASTDPDQVVKWFGRHPERNLAVVTGAPGPDVLDIDSRGPAASGFPALERLRAAGLLDGAVGQVRTPSGGLHLYFEGSSQRTAHLPASHVDFLAVGGYVLIPPSRIDGRPYRNLGNLPGNRDHLNWQAAARLLEPSRDHQRPAPLPAAAERISILARWVADQPEGNRNNGLFWAANRALEADHAADLSPLAAAARQAGLTDPEINRTLDSARRTSQATRSPVAARPKEAADMTTNPQPTGHQPPAAPARPADGHDTDTREQIRRLRAQGGTYRSIAGAAGLAPSTVHDLESGRRNPTSATTRALAKVSGSSLRRARVDACGTRLRLRALHVMGHGSARIARALGVREMTIREIVRGDARIVSSKLRDQVTGLYDAWWDKRAPERSRAERAAATAARRRAIAGNWCAGAGLDDDQLDIPGYKPKSKWKPAAGTGTAPDIHQPGRPSKNRDSHRGRKDRRR